MASFPLGTVHGFCISCVYYVQHLSVIFMSMRFHFAPTHGYEVLHMAIAKEISIQNSGFMMLIPMGVHMIKDKNGCGVVV